MQFSQNCDIFGMYIIIIKTLRISTFLVINISHGLKISCSIFISTLCATKICRTRKPLTFSFQSTHHCFIGINEDKICQRQTLPKLAGRWRLTKVHTENEGVS